MKRLVIIIICILILLVSLTACSNQSSNYVDKDDGEPLTICIPDNNEFLKHYIDKYNAAHDTTQIEYDVIAKEYLSVYYNKMVSEMYNEKGPNIILIDYTFTERKDIYKLYKDGLFADMDKLIERSLVFDAQHYNENVLDTGVINDTRVFIPVTHRLDIAVAAVNHFNEIGIEPPEELGLEELVHFIELYKQGHSYYTPFFGMDINTTIFEHINEDHTVDNEDQIIKLIKLTTKRNAYTESVEYLMKIYDAEWYELYSGFYNLFTIVTGGENIFASFNYQHNYFKYILNSEMVYYCYPLTASEFKSYPDTAFAINAVSNKKNRAFKFIEYMLSDTVQSDNLYGSIPVRRDSYSQAKQKLLNGDYNSLQQDLVLEPVCGDIVNQFIDMVDSSTCEFTNYFHINKHCIVKTIHDYRCQDVASDDTVKAINANLDKYYNPDEEE